MEVALAFGVIAITTIGAVALYKNRGESIVEFKFSLVDDESELVIVY